MPPGSTFIRFIATPRSGHHAVQNWFLAGCEGPVWLRDNIYRPLQRDHFFGAAHRSGLPHVPRRDDIRGAVTLAAGYEKVSIPKIEISHPIDLGWLPETDGRRDIIILRDPFNNFASFLAMERRPAGGKKPNVPGDRLVDLWIQFAARAANQYPLGRGGAAPEVILYDEWLRDPEVLAARLGIAHVPAAAAAVPRQGQGSSFGGDPRAGRATLIRWREFLTDPEWRSMLTMDVWKLACEFWSDLAVEVSSAIYGEEPAP